MAYSRKFLTVGALGVAAFALIGAGASATFNDSVDANQRVTAGTMNLQITDGDGGTVTSDGKTVTLPSFASVNSTFESPHKVITVTNNGDIPVKSLSFQMAGTHGSSPQSNVLWNQVNVCIQSTHGNAPAFTEGNGPLTTAVVLTPTVSHNPVSLAPGQWMTFSVDLYAGKDSSECNATHSDSNRNRLIWDGYLGGGYEKPASLTNDAMGGVITPKLTFSFTG